MVKESNTYHIFIGPQKTGTSWIYNLFTDDLKDKEIAFPVKYGRKYVYEKYVMGSKILVWPYLLHHPLRLTSLLETIETTGDSFQLYSTQRPKDSWVLSMTKFRMRNGRSKDFSASYAEDEWRRVAQYLDGLSEKYPISYLNVFEPTEKDINLLSELSGKTTEEIVLAIDKPVYETKGKSRIIINGFVRIYFFHLKPYLPRFLRNITKNKLLLKIFYKY